MVRRKEKVTERGDFGERGDTIRKKMVDFIFGHAVRGPPRPFFLERAIKKSVGDF